MTWQAMAMSGNASGASYYWPSGHGRVGEYSASSYVGPKNLSASFAWSWHHPGGKYHTLPYGTAIDDERNIYVTTDTSMWKLSPEGKALWSFTPSPRATIFAAGALLDGRAHFTTLDGRVFALSMATGEQLWSRKVCDSINGDNAFVSADDGVVVFAACRGKVGRGGNAKVFGVSAADGSQLWSYGPDTPVWNFLANFAGDGTVLYQDWEGKAYRHDAKTGSLIWKAGGQRGSWTDGSPLFAQGVFYTVSANMEQAMLRMLLPGVGQAPGQLTARRLDDGQELWTAPVPLPPNNVPAVGHLHGQSGLSVVQPGGIQGVKGGPTGIYAYEAATGARQWSFQGPSQKKKDQAGAVEGRLERILAGASAGYVTNPWSAPTVDADGTIFIGHEDGLFFALSDLNMDGKLEGANEVSTFDTGAAFVGSSGPAHAPGMLAVASCDTLFVFKSGS